MFSKSPISQDSLMGKFQNWAEMNVNFSNNKRNTKDYLYIKTEQASDESLLPFFVLL